MKQTIDFYLDGKLIELDPQAEGIKPSTSVLNYLRALPSHKGVKEGCAEGDCGACTIVLAEPCKSGKHLKYTAVNSCLLFLPMLDGKQVITIENLAQGEQLHPVQEALVEAHGSQCGFCTPGIVMSMFALYHQRGKVDRTEAEDALSGNLCRCTGYRPIMDACINVIAAKTSDAFDKNEASMLHQLQELHKKRCAAEFRSANQLYMRPSKLSEALQCRDKHPEAIIINGATDIALRQTKKFEHLPSILDLSAIAELRQFEVLDQSLHIGSGLNLESIRRHSSDDLPVLSQLLDVFAARQIRNVATLGGNVGSASPIGDTLPLLFVLQAQINLVSIHGERSLPIESFIKGYRATDIKPNEIIKSIQIPLLESNSICRSYKVSKRKDLDISTLSAAFYMSKNDDGTLREVRVALGGMAATTVRSTFVEEFLINQAFTRMNAEICAGMIESEFSPISDARSSDQYRRRVAGNLIMKFWSENQDFFADEK